MTASAIDAAKKRVRRIRAAKISGHGHNRAENS